MRTTRPWQGIRMRQVAASADPDREPRLVSLPASWDDRAADALAALAPGDEPVSLASAAMLWLGQIVQRSSRAEGRDAGLVAQLQRLLRLRQAAPNEAVWRDDGGSPGFVLNAAGFFDPDTGWDVAAFGDAAEASARACLLLAPGCPAYRIGFAGLDDLLACLGLAYDSRAARSVASCLATLLRGRVDQVLEGDQRDLLATGADFPPPPPCPVPGLSEAAAAARRGVYGTPGTATATGIFPPGPVEALLGIETGGIAPAYSPVRERRLTRAAQDRLAAARLSPEAALAAALLGEAPLPSADLAAHAAMHDAVARTLQSMPPRPCALPSPSVLAPQPRKLGPTHQKLPARHGGLTQKASVGGHRVFLRTAEYADGRLGEIAVSLPREAALARGLMDSLSQAVSLGLQHGIPLDVFVDALALSDFGPAGQVEGDPAVGCASSLVDYVMRSLAATYLGRTLPEAECAATGTEDAMPMLPLDLPRDALVRARRRSLRLVQSH